MKKPTRPAMITVSLHSKLREEAFKSGKKFYFLLEEAFDFYLKNKDK